MQILLKMVLLLDFVTPFRTDPLIGPFHGENPVTILGRSTVFARLTSDAAFERNP
jgi:hypothetical protein